MGAQVSAEARGIGRPAVVLIGSCLAPSVNAGT